MCGEVATTKSGGFGRFVILVIRVMPALLLMALVFALSTQTAAESAALSRKVKVEIVRVMNPGFDELTKKQQNKLVASYAFDVRDLAHGTLFLLLMIALLPAFYIFKKDFNARCMLALFTCLLFAISDEVHQIFVDGRGAQLTDIWLDCGGSAMGLALSAFARACFLGLRRLFRRTKTS